jgi:DNA-binding transcriptional LysR family regulator
MPRNLDLTVLRSFVAVADMGGVTRAASMLNLTQSAVSMQLKRLEESLDAALLDRSSRTIGLTSAGEQLLSSARKMIAINDQIYSQMTDDAYEGVLVLGVPHDLIYPSIPKVLQLFNADYPRMRVQLLSSWTVRLRELFAEGKCDLILTTEDHCDAGGETLTKKPLLWYGAPGGSAWQRRPLPLASEPHCQFRKSMQALLDQAGIPWDMAVDSESTRTIEASVSADLAIMSQLEDAVGPQVELVPHGGALPELGFKLINFYVSEVSKDHAKDHLVDLVRRNYRAPHLALAV